MRILQTLQTCIPSYRRYVVDLPSQLTGLERLLHRIFPQEVLNGFELFLRRDQYDIVVTADYRTSVIFGILSNLLGRKSLHIVKELYLDECVLASRLKRWVFRRSLAHCDAVITNCTSEIAAYSAFLDVPADRFHFLPWPSNIPVCEAKADNGYIFAAGRSFRDWRILFEVAREIPSCFEVVAQSGDVAGLERPANVTLHCDIPRDQYLELLKGARLVVVPLLPTVRSIGQATLLEAMAFGKPVVAASCPGVIDYITHGENGLLYEVGNRTSLAEQIRELLTSADLCDAMSRGAISSIQQTFNKSAYAERMLDLAHRLLLRRSRENSTCMVKQRMSESTSEQSASWGQWKPENDEPAPVSFACLSSKTENQGERISTNEEEA